MKPTQVEMLTYIQQFITRIRREGSFQGHIQPEQTLQQLGLDSMDFVELHVCLLDDYEVDMFKILPPNFQHLYLEDFVRHIWHEIQYSVESN